MKEDTIKLVKRAIKGNMDAYGKLIAEYQIYLYKTAFLYVKNEADSLDAVQECVIKGMLGIEKLREPRYFKTWITRILLNCIWQEKKTVPTISLEEYDGKGCENYLIEEKVDLYDAIEFAEGSVQDGNHTLLFSGIENQRDRTGSGYSGRKRQSKPVSRQKTA